MNNQLRQHFEKTTELPQAIINEVVSMFNNEAIILIDALSNLNPSVRDTVLDSLRKYHEALDSNQVIFTEA